MIYVLLIAAGLIFGSFINALIWRLHEQSKFYDDEGKPKKLSVADKKRLHELSIAKGRSMCSKCGHPLAAKDLVPLFSWLYLRGRCRYCKARIGDTPLIEAGLPALLVLSYIFWPRPFDGALEYVLLGVWALIVTCFVALAVYDAKWFLLPNKIVFPLIGLSGVFAATVAAASGQWSTVVASALAALTLSGVFLVLYLASKGAWIGFGDVKLAVALGLIVGAPMLSLLVIFVASVSGTLAATPQLFRGSSMKTAIPFGPHLLLATVIVFLFGQSLIDLYLKLLTV